MHLWIDGCLTSAHHVSCCFRFCAKAAVAAAEAVLMMSALAFQLSAVDLTSHSSGAASCCLSVLHSIEHNCFNLKLAATAQVCCHLEALQISCSCKTPPEYLLLNRCICRVYTAESSLPKNTVLTFLPVMITPLPSSSNASSRLSASLPVQWLEKCTFLRCRYAGN